MLLLFDAYIDHNADAAPTPWAGRLLSTIKEDKSDNKSERKLLQENQTVLIKFGMNQSKETA
jgi:hypothetical protein